MKTFPAPPIRTQFPQDGNEKLFSRAWANWFQAVSTGLSFTPPTVTGSRGGNAAVTSLLAGLAAEGLIVDQSTP